MEDKLKKLVGKKVTKSSSGGGAGSILVLEFENASYFYILCSWRISHENSILVTSSDTIVPEKDNSSPNGFIGENTPVLLEKKVVNINLSSYYDLEINFEEGYKMQVFCDVGIYEDEYDINWELNMPADNICIGITNHLDVNSSSWS